MYKRIAIDVGVVLVLAALYFTQSWVRQRYAEFTVMRTVVVAVACGNPAEAAKLGIGCPGAAPEPGAAVPAQNGTPAAPVSAEKPGDDKKPR